MNIDLEILYFFNRTIASPALDPIVKILTEVRYWAPVYILSALLVLYFKKWEGLRLIVSTVVFVGLLNTVTNEWVKPLVHRERPCTAMTHESELQWLRLPDNARGGYSFPSSHALNNFAGIVFFMALFPEKKWLRWLLVPAIIISLTRLYLGLHYPSDVAGGAAIGAIAGWGWAIVHRMAEKRLDKKQRRGEHPLSP